MSRQVDVNVLINGLLDEVADQAAATARRMAQLKLELLVAKQENEDEVTDNGNDPVPASELHQ